MAMREIKVCVLGNTGVGKSCLSLRYVNGIFDDTVTNTIGAAFLSKETDIAGQAFKFQIWDTAGQEKYRGLAPMYYRHAMVAILVYDVTSEETFLSLKDWLDELKFKGPKDVLLTIVGNKCDLAKDLWEVTTEEASEFAKSVNAEFFESSAVTGENIEEIFGNIGVRLPGAKVGGAPTKKNSITVDDGRGGHKGKCPC